MEFKEFYLVDNEGRSNCVIRTFCKIFDKDYNTVYNDLFSLSRKLNCESYNDIEVFETYMEERNIISVNYGKDLKIKDLNLNNGIYVVFCWDGKDFYHMLPIINNVIYDKDDSCLELYSIKIYKQKF